MNDHTIAAILAAWSEPDSGLVPAYDPPDGERRAKLSDLARAIALRVVDAENFEEADRQAMVLALAELALSRPGWAVYLRGIASKVFQRGRMFEAFLATSPRPPEERFIMWLWLTGYRVTLESSDGDVTGENPAELLERWRDSDRAASAYGDIAPELAPRREFVERAMRFALEELGVAEAFADRIEGIAGEFMASGLYGEEEPRTPSLLRKGGDS